MCGGHCQTYRFPSNTGGIWQSWISLDIGFDHKFSLHSGPGTKLCSSIT